MVFCCEFCKTFKNAFLQNCKFIKKETLAQVFSREHCETSKNTFLTEHLWTTASVFIKQRGF